MPVYLDGDRLEFVFPEVHEDARFAIEFQRTLRIPDDGSDYPLPPGLGCFSLRHVDDYGGRVPSVWAERGGVLLPMYQAEAMWIHFLSLGYPFAVKIATGKINAVSGSAWSYGLRRDPQDYVVLSDQPWLDGYAVEKGVIRQFVAMPLGSGATAEEQITGKAEWGGLQILAYPLKPKLYEKVVRERLASMGYIRQKKLITTGMGMAPGGRMRQDIYSDRRPTSDWDLEHGLRCFVSVLNSSEWSEATGEPVPSEPVPARAYAEAGLPWFDYYAEDPAESGSARLAALKPVSAFAERIGPEAGDLVEPVAAAPVIKLGPQTVQQHWS